jgi:hypothetical protein
VAIGLLNERLNTALSISRVHGQFSGPAEAVPFDRIEISFEINTEAENEENRFTGEHLVEFLDRAIQIRSEVLSQLEDLTHD